MIKPDETTGGRRIYGPVTLATILVAAELRLQGVHANHALVQAHLITKVAMEWFAGRALDYEDLEAGQIPTFDRDFRDQVAIFNVRPAPSGREPSEPGVTLLPGIVHLNICHRDEIGKWLDKPIIHVVNLSRLWIELSLDAWDLKRPQMLRKGVA